jgi:hypothetical protein
MDESPTAVASGPDVPRDPVSEDSQLEQWNWIARARSAAARSLGLVSENGPGPVEAADPGEDSAPAP